jgi:hypothetical protein
VAEATAKEIGRLSLDEALELTLLIARKDPRRHPRVAARWLRRYLDEYDGVTIDEAAMASACLSALDGAHHAEAARMLRTTWLGRVRGRPGRELRPLTTDTGAAIVDSPVVPRRFGVSVSELSLGAARAVERELRRLVVGEIGASALVVRRPPDGTALGAPQDDSNALRTHGGQTPSRSSSWTASSARSTSCSATSAGRSASTASWSRTFCLIQVL